MNNRYLINTLMSYDINCAMCAGSGKQFVQDGADDYRVEECGCFEEDTITGLGVQEMNEAYGTNVKAYFPCFTLKTAATGRKYVDVI